MNIALVWDDTRSRGDWQVVGGRLTTGSLLQTAVLISLFTDRVAQPDYVAADGDRRGWWHDTFEGIPIGSRLWQLRRRKIAKRQDLINEATDICREALQWLIDKNIASKIDLALTLPPAGLRSSGTLLTISANVFQPAAPPTEIRALWSTV